MRMDARINLAPRWVPNSSFHGGTKRSIGEWFRLDRIGDRASIQSNAVPDSQDKAKPNERRIA